MCYESYTDTHVPKTPMQFTKFISMTLKSECGVQ